MVFIIMFIKSSTETIMTTHKEEYAKFVDSIFKDKTEEEKEYNHMFGWDTYTNKYTAKASRIAV